MPTKRLPSAHRQKWGFKPALIWLAAILVVSTACGDSAPSPEASAGDSVGDAASRSAPEAARPAPDLVDRPAWLDAHPILSPNAKIDTHRLLIEERRRTKSPGDGEGRIWIDRIQRVDASSDGDLMPVAIDGESRPLLVVRSSYRFELVFEVGRNGIHEGGYLFISPEPFWGWSSAQVDSPEAPGFTTARPRNEGVVLEPAGPDGSFLVTGRDLEPGELIDVVYGASATGARVDRYAQRRAEILFGVDADGDGFRAWGETAATVDIVSAGATGIVAFGPAEVRPGESFEFQIAAIDEVGNRSSWPNTSGVFEIHLDEESTTGVKDRTPLTVKPKNPLTPVRVRLGARDEPGTLRISVMGVGDFADFKTTLNPILVRDSDRRLFWADLHGHSGYSDGTGTPEDYFTYARDVARLDAIALTDHDHWGVRPLDELPAHVNEIQDDVERFHQPGRFVTIPGYEWTSWLHGHRHVLYFDDEGETGSASMRDRIHSSIDPATDRPDELWSALRGQAALTFAHHSAGEPIATNWFYRPDPILEPVTEIASVHGMSEASDAPFPVEGAIPGYFVRDTLLRGDRLGFIGSGDSHDGHPGLVQLAGPPHQGGLAGIVAEKLDRKSLLAALRARRTFATNGIRAWLEVMIDETPMGGTLERDEATSSGQRLHIRYEGTAPIQSIDLIRSGVIAVLPGENRLSLDFEREIPRLGANDFHYVRIVQIDGGVAWSSPIFGGEPEIEEASRGAD